MRFPILMLLVCSFLLLPAARTAFPEDYLKKAIMPEGAEDRTIHVYPAFDFEDVIFTREYFYTLEEGTRQLRRATVSPWTRIEITPPAAEDLKETSPEPGGD